MNKEVKMELPEELCFHSNELLDVGSIIENIEVDYAESLARYDTALKNRYRYSINVKDAQLEVELVGEYAGTTLLITAKKATISNVFERRNGQ